MLSPDKEVIMLYTLNPAFADILRKKSSPFAEQGYELRFGDKPASNEEGEKTVYGGQIVASTQFNMSQVFFTYTTDAPVREGGFSVFVGKQFERAISTLAGLGESFELTVGDAEIFVKSGSAQLTVPIKTEAAMVTLAMPKKENIVPVLCGTDVFRSAVRQSMAAALTGDEYTDILTIYPHKEALAVYATNRIMVGKADVPVTPANAEAYAALDGTTVSVKSTELKSLLPVLEGEQIRLYFAPADKQFLIQSGHDLYAFRLLEKGIPLKEEFLEQMMKKAKGSTSCVIKTAQLQKAIAVATVLQTEDPAITLTGSKEGLSVSDKEDLSCGMTIPVKPGKKWEDFRARFSSIFFKNALSVCGDEFTLIHTPNPGKNGGALAFVKGENFMISMISKSIPVKAEKPSKDEAEAESGEE